jgi:hypothetical protein
MSKNIYLDNLVDFSITTYANLYGQYIISSKNDILNEITKIKNNNSINEKGVFIPYNYIELSSLLDIEQNELVLIYPICFNIENENEKEWYNFLNTLLLVLNPEYINQNNNLKKKYIQSLNDQYVNKKISIVNKINEKILKEISILTNIKLIILNYDNECKIKIIDNISSNKYIVIYKLNNEYFPVYNFNTKYYLEDSKFIKYLIEKNNLINENKEKDNIIKENINLIETKNDYYDEFQTNEDYTLYVSEAVENKNTLEPKIQEVNSDNKKKKKNDKNIFIPNKIDKTNVDKTNVDKTNNEDSVFIKTEVINKDDISKIYQSFKSTSKLEEIQNLALKIGLKVFSGATKDGKPKNKTKSELLEDIKNYLEKK